jgi:hypothetical protein
VQNPTGTATGSGEPPQQVDTDNSGWAHIAYIQLGCGATGASTGYAVQTAGTPVGFPNN